MKKTLSVNLGNRVFHIDEDAYIKLKAYLEHIETYFGDAREREDIISDIELRISELFNDRLGINKLVITLTDVSEVIAIMGEPNEIGESAGPGRSEYHPLQTRRIYRDPDDRMLGGVCAGLAAYAGIDPTIMRLLFVFFLFMGGIGVLAYIILWVVLPEARTTAQKIEMTGNTVNASNIGKFLRDEFEQVKKSFRRKK